MTAKIDRRATDGNVWCRCAKCSHKLGRLVGQWKEMRAMPAIEIKCHSCGTINYLMVGGAGNGRAMDDGNS